MSRYYHIVYSGLDSKIAPCSTNMIQLYEQCNNKYDTYEDAELVLNKYLVLEQLKNYAKKYNDAELDWTSPDQLKCTYRYDYKTHAIELELTTLIKYPNSDIYFTSIDIANSALTEIGYDRIKRYYLGVDDDDI